MTLTDLQQTIADNLGISPDALTSGADTKERHKRQLSDFQVIAELKFDIDNNHPEDTPANRRKCRKFVRSNLKRMKQEQQRQHDVDPTKCKFIGILILWAIEGIVSWMIGKGLDEWWTWKNSTPNANVLVAGMACEVGCMTVISEGGAMEPGLDDPDDDNDDDDDDGVV